ncbi:16020_t:CDS:1 [Cetraspora pellucida]|uniref:16020_t:CDS:1 n=1 Tax=Cetraspora pellucida TaxID=1433469 RepID=A0A9N8WJ76_9GLOM|nr:16020_t:CDS:1 [Cetraspora pellucida]
MDSLKCTCQSSQQYSISLHDLDLNITRDTTIPISYQKYESLSSCQFHALHHQKILDEKVSHQKMWKKQKVQTQSCLTNTLSKIHPQSMFDSLLEIMQQDLKITEEDNKSSTIDTMNVVSPLFSSTSNASTQPTVDFQKHSLYCECRGSGVGCQCRRQCFC